MKTGTGNLICLLSFLLFSSFASPGAHANRNNALTYSSNINGSLEHNTVFSGGEDGYITYRIPSLISASDGTLIAIAEARRDNRQDPGGGHIDLVYKLSHDGGRSWSSLRMFAQSREGWSSSNPTSVIKNSDGRILVLYNVWKPGRSGNPGPMVSRPGEMDCQLKIRYSDDNGRSWSDERDITHQGRDVNSWGIAVFGPGHGIETRSGRLVVPVNANSPGYEHDHPDKKWSSFALYSDDGGENWNRGEQVNEFACENQIVELDDGRLMIDARVSDRDTGFRWTAISGDQGETWSEPEPGQVCPPIAASIISYPNPDINKNSLLLWSGLKGPGRKNLVLRLSSDQGISFPLEILTGPGHAAYSAMYLIDNGDVGVLWEGGKETPYDNLIFTRVSKEIIMQLQDMSAITRETY